MQRAPVVSAAERSASAPAGGLVGITVKASAALSVSMRWRLRQGLFPGSPARAAAANSRSYSG